MVDHIDRRLGAGNAAAALNLHLRLPAIARGRAMLPQPLAAQHMPTASPDILLLLAAGLFVLAIPWLRRRGGRWLWS